MTMPSISAVDQLTEPPPSISAQNVCKDAEEPGSPLRLPPRHVPKVLTLKKAHSPRKSISPWKFSGRLPLQHAPHPTTTANTEAGPSHVVITSTPKLVSGNDLLALPPIPIDIYHELTSMFSSIKNEQGMSNEEATHHKFGREVVIVYIWT